MESKVVLITGASAGFGKACAEHLHRLGHRVYGTSRRARFAPEAAAGRGVAMVPLDVTSEDSVRAAVAFVHQREGRLDVVVNNAGVVISKPFTGYTAADYATVVGAGLTGFFWLTQRAIGEMAVRYGGHVVNVSAIVADVADSGSPAVLTALTKGALAAATRSLALEYASRGIRVNAVSPGIIQTPVHPGGDGYGCGGLLPPLGRVGQISDVVDGVLFLESSPFITGEILHIDGGQVAGHSEALG